MLSRLDVDTVNLMIEELDIVLALMKDHTIFHSYPESVRGKMIRETNSILEVRKMEIIKRLKDQYGVKVEV